MTPDPAPRPLTDRVADDVGGALTVGLAYIGDKLGLFATLAKAGPVGSDELARQAGLHERYVREWLKAMVAARYVEHDPATDRYFMTAEEAAVLAQEGGRTFLAGAFAFALPSLLLTPRLIDAFVHGGGIPFSELPAEIPEAIDRMHRPWFDHLLVQEWLPAAPSLVDALTRGIAVLDVGCGIGRSTVALARAFPASRFVGVDPHEPSIQRARALAADAAVANVTFAALAVEGLHGHALATTPFDLIVAIDCIHDMVDPVGALRAIGGLLSPAGQVFWSEPTGSREPLENRNPQGRIRSNLSPFHCLTVSMAAGGAALGTIIGEAGARELAAQAGFGFFQKLAIDNGAQQFFLLRSGA